MRNVETVQLDAIVHCPDGCDYLLVFVVKLGAAPDYLTVSVYRDGEYILLKRFTYRAVHMAQSVQHEATFIARHLTSYLNGGDRVLTYLYELVKLLY